jgi:hypothetical protein
MPSYARTAPRVGEPQTLAELDGIRPPLVDFLSRRQRQQSPRVRSVAGAAASVDPECTTRKEVDG